MSRSLWKGYFLNNSLFKHSKKINLKIWSRSSTVPSFLIGKMVLVHSGKEFKKILITREKVGFKFGEFVFTRSKIPKSKKSKVLKNKKK